MRRIFGIFLWLFSFGTSFAITISVPTDFPTIATAIDAAKSGDTVSVAPGVYSETLDFGGKSLVVRSQQGPDSTALRAPNGFPVSSLVLMTGIGADGAVLSGFRIDSVSHDGGVVRVENSRNCVIEQCRFKDNSGVDSVAAVLVSLSTSCELRDNTFENNAGAGGGAVVIGQSTVIVTGNTFRQNTRIDGNGAAIWAGSAPTTVQIEYNFFTENAGPGDALISLSDNSGSTISNNTFVDNSVARTINGDTVAIIGNIFADSSAIAIDSGATESCNCFYRTIAPTTLDPTSFIGNPLFCDAFNGDYSIAFTSPCAPANNTCSTLVGAFDPVCDVFTGPVWHVGIGGNDSTGVGSADSPFATIQRGIDAAAAGDTVLVGPGTYTGFGNLDLNTLGKAIAVMSAAGPDSTIIEYGYFVGGLFFSRAMTINSGEDNGTVIDGFKFTDDGYWPTYGKAVAAIGSAPLIRNCIFSHLRASSAILCDSASPALNNCRFEQNVCGCSGCKVDEPDNRAYSMRAAAILFVNGSAGEVRDCEFVNNIADVPSGGGVISCDRSSPRFVNCTFADNEGYYSCRGTAAVIVSGSAAAFDTCRFIANRNDNFGYTRNRYGFAIYQKNSSAIFNDCLLAENAAYSTGSPLCAAAIFADSGAVVSLSNTTVVSHDMTSAGGFPGFYLGAGATLSMSRSILAYNLSRPVIGIEDSSVQLDLSCTDIFGNESGNWTGPLAALAESNGNLEANPLFCDTASGDFALRDISPCAASNNACSTLIGAFDTACVNTPPVITSADSIVIAEHDTLSYTVAFTDPDGPDTTVTVAALPSWCVLSGDTVSGSPGDGTPDTVFTVIVSDGYAADTQFVYVDVLPVNDPPIFVPPPMHTVNEGELLEFVVSVTDSDSDTTRISVAAPPEGATFVDSLTGSGLFSWQPSYTQAGAYQVLFVAQDDSLAVDSVVVEITVNQVNLAPVLDSIPDQIILEGEHLELLVTSADFDNDSISLVAELLPANALFADSGDGRGLLTFDPADDQSGDYAVLIIAGDSALADSQVVNIAVRDINPIIESVFVDGISPNTHVVNHTPVISWTYHDPLDARAQIQFRIGIGTDPDSEYHEVWDPAPFDTGDTSIVYSGDSLFDGSTYYLFLEVNNGYTWSVAYLDSFHMNDVPTVPVPISPSADAVTLALPIVWLANSSDSQNDPLLYDFELWLDTAAGVPDTQRVFGVGETVDSTGWSVPDALQEDRRYIWRGRSDDGYESSAWSPTASFYVNAEESAPSSPLALPLPNDTCATIDSMPTLTWTASTDPDPFDTVRYTLRVGLNAQLEFHETYEFLSDTVFTIPVALIQGNHYWWQVTAFDRTGDSSLSNLDDFYVWVPGDVSNDHAINIADVTALVIYLFQGGSAPCPHVGDVNGTCAINVADLTYLVAFVFAGGPAPLLCEGEVIAPPTRSVAKPVPDHSQPK